MYQISTAQNSDNIADRIATFEEDNKLFFVVADGAGDSSDAAEAAEMVVKLFQQSVHGEEIDSPDFFEAILRGIDQTIFEELDGGEVSVVIGQVIDGVVIGASSGDSVCFHYGEQFYYELTSLQYPKPLIGSNHATPIGFGPIRLETLLIGSDGFFKYIDQNQVVAEVKKGCLAAATLIEQAANETGKYHDDCSLIIICG